MKLRYKTTAQLNDDMVYCHWVGTPLSPRGFINHCETGHFYEDPEEYIWRLGGVNILRKRRKR